jgi:hypothetical protein
MIDANRLSETRPLVLKIVIIVFGLIAGLFLLSVLPTFAGDFHDLYIAGQRLATGRSPYEWQRYYNPIIVAIAFLPLAILPEALAYRLFTLISLIILTGCALSVRRRLPLAVWVIWLTQLLLLQIVWGTIDYFVWAALLAPPPIGIVLAMCKPQTGWLLAVILWWALPRKQRLPMAVLVGLMLVVSFLAGMRAPSLDAVQLWNISPFPWLVPIGIGAVVLAWRRRDRELALSATLLVTPYFQRPSLIVAAPLALRGRVTKWVTVAVTSALVVELAMKLS